MSKFKFKVGDKVKIIKEISKWKGNCWMSGMDEHIGQIVTIKNIDDIDNEFKIVEDEIGYYFPFECAGLVQIKRKRNGFSVQYQTKEDIHNYKVYYETKGKVIFCTIEDYAFNKSFRGKSVCHKDDVFDEQEGRKIAFIKAYAKYIDWLEKFRIRVSEELGNKIHMAEKIRDKNSKFIHKN